MTNTNFITLTNVTFSEIIIDRLFIETEFNNSLLFNY